MANRETVGNLMSVKCSECGTKIAISEMGDHVCGSLPKDEPLPPVPAFDQSAVAENGARAAGGFLKPGRPGPPPRINPSLANWPFLRPNELTPSSSEPSSRESSPSRPSFDTMRSRRNTNRSLVSPLPQTSRPPSPPSPVSPMKSNLDSAFPPFPRSTSRAASRSPKPDTRGLMSAFSKDPRSNSQYSSMPTGSSYHSRGRSIPNIGGRRPSNAGSTPRSFTTDGNKSEPSERPLPALPPMNSQRSGKAIGDRDGIALRLDTAERRPVRIGGYGGMGDDDASEYGGAKDTIVASPEEQKALWTQPLPGPYDSQMRSQTTRGQPRLPTNLGSSVIEDPRQALSQPSPSPLRSQTFPRQEDVRNNSREPMRRPTEPSARSRKPSISSNTGIDGSKKGPPPPFQTKAISGSSGRFPPRKDSRSGPRPAFGNPFEPMPGNPFMQNLDIGNPYHTPTDSASSNGSEASAVPTASSQSSVTYSPPRPSRGRKGSRDQTLLRIPSRSKGRYEGSDSPTDPLFQKGRLSPTPLPESKPAPLAQRQGSGDSVQRPSTRNGAPKGRCRGCSKMIYAGEKSVSSADGRLTGRYHKACFACHTCQSPFATADFYVLNDAPYCGKHYHEANGSLCGGCGEGIEGQCFEVDTDDSTSKPLSNMRIGNKSKKFHPTCFTCTKCKIMLNEDYFIWSGKPYCERDARVAAGFDHSRSSSNPPLPPSLGMNSMRTGKSMRVPPNNKNRSNGLLAPGMGLPMGGPAGPARRFPERRTTKMMMI